MNTSAAVQEFNYQNYLLRSITYEAYSEQLKQIVANIDMGLNPNSAHSQYLPINLTRMQRIAKTAQLSKELLLAIARMKSKVYWLVLTEYWCGDAAQSLPLLHKVAQASQGKIVLRLLQRDKHPALMEKHLTNGSSAIPKLIQLNTEFTFLNEWGPRPKPAQELVKLLKSDPLTAPFYAEQLHSWYAKDKTNALQQELVLLLEQTDNAPIPLATISNY